MSTLTFKEQLALDVKGVFLKEFSQVAIYKSGINLKEISLQLFEEPLEKMGTQYYHAWCAYTDVPRLKNGELFEIDGIEYGVVDSTSDEFQDGINIFLQKV